MDSNVEQCLSFSRYAWGEEAFEKSRKEQKPIFLSGTCLKHERIANDENGLFQKWVFPGNYCLF
jgi:hypothetical protein